MWLCLIKIFKYLENSIIVCSMETNKIFEQLKSLHPRFGEMNIRRMAVFGSHARGNAVEGSDVDLLVDFIETPGMFGFLATKHSLEDYLGKPVDLITFASLKSARQKSILNEAIDV